MQACWCQAPRIEGDTARYDLTWTARTRNKGLQHKAPKWFIGSAKTDPVHFKRSFLGEGVLKEKIAIL